MDFVTLGGAVVGVYARELDVFTEVVAAFSAEEALFAWHAGLNRHPVSCERR